MTKRPIVSIIIPMYNHERFIERALASITVQDYRPLQVIAIDDGSKDKTLAIAKDFLRSRMPQAIVIERDNRGPAQTINEAVRLSDGDYINILNSDDEFTADRISSCVSLAQRSSRGMIFGAVDLIGEDSKPSEVDDYVLGLHSAQAAAGSYPTIGFALMRNQLAISSGNLFFSRKIAKAIGPFRSYRYVHDWDYLLRSIYFEEPLRSTQIMYRYRMHGSNSFRSLGHLAGYETTEVMRNFVWSMVCRLPCNHRAPSPHYWPGVFENTLSEWDYQVYLPPFYRRPSGLWS